MIKSKVKSSFLDSMKVGDELLFKVPHPRDIETAKSLCYRRNKTNPERNIKFSTNVDFENLLIKIIANPKSI